MKEFGAPMKTICSTVFHQEEHLREHFLDSSASLHDWQLTRRDRICRQSCKRRDCRWCNPGHVIVKECLSTWILNRWLWVLSTERESTRVICWRHLLSSQMLPGNIHDTPKEDSWWALDIFNEASLCYTFNFPIVCCSDVIHDCWRAKGFMVVHRWSKGFYCFSHK